MVGQAPDLPCFRECRRAERFQQALGVNMVSSVPNGNDFFATGH